MPTTLPGILLNIAFLIFFSVVFCLIVWGVVRIVRWMKKAENTLRDPRYPKRR